MQVKLIAITHSLLQDSSPEALIEHAGRICYRSESQGQDARARFIERRHIKLIKKPLGDKSKKLSQMVKKLGFDPKYYLVKDQPTRSMYDAGFRELSKGAAAKDDQIYVLIRGKNVELSQCSDIFSKIAAPRERTSYFVPKEVRDRL